MDSDKVVRDSIIISLAYCFIFMMIYISFIQMEPEIINRVVTCVTLFIIVLVIGCCAGGLIGSLLQYRLDYNSGSWKHFGLLLICNLLSPLILYLLIKYPVEYLE